MNFVKSAYYEQFVCELTVVFAQSEDLKKSVTQCATDLFTRNQP